jgi:AcrR family transcriptional regulator
MAEVKRTRREKADATRRKILHAAEAEFETNGFHGATITSIAKRAGVASQTIYFVFHTKPALISALIDSLVMGEDPVIPQDTEWWRAMIEEPDPTQALEHFIRGAGPLFARASSISEILRGAALTDDEVRRTYDFHEKMRAAGFREVIEIIAAKGRLRLSVKKATDVLLTMYGDSSYYLMTKERGWTHDEYVEWACQALPELLVEPDERLKR